MPNRSTAKVWPRVEPTIITKVDRRTVVLKTFTLPDNKPQTFATFHAEDSLSGAVIALTTDNKVITARQFRVGPEKIMNDIPGGGIEPGEDPQAGVMRELLEETGYVAEKVEFIGTSSRDAYVNAIWYYYFATGCRLSRNGQNLDHGEYVDVELMSVSDFLKCAKNDLMTDPAAVLFAYEKLKALEEK